MARGPTPVNIDSRTRASSPSSTSDSSDRGEDKKRGNSEGIDKDLLTETGEKEKGEKPAQGEQEGEKTAPTAAAQRTSSDSSTQTVAEKRAPLEALQMAEHLTRMFHANKCPLRKVTALPVSSAPRLRYSGATRDAVTTLNASTIYVDRSREH